MGVCEFNREQKLTLWLAWEHQGTALGEDHGNNLGHHATKKSEWVHMKSQLLPCLGPLPHAVPQPVCPSAGFPFPYTLHVVHSLFLSVTPLPPTILSFNLPPGSSSFPIPSTSLHQFSSFPHSPNSAPAITHLLPHTHHSLLLTDFSLVPVAGPGLPLQSPQEQALGISSCFSNCPEKQLRNLPDLLWAAVK